MPDTAPPKKPEAREIASIVGYGRDITRSYLGPLLEPQDKVLRQRWFDYEIYEEILRDDQVKAVFQQRRSAVVSREWDVTPGGESRQDKAAAAFIRETLKRIRWDNVTDKMLFGVFYGFAVGECIYAYEDGKVQLNAIKVRKQRRFRFDWEMQPRLLTWDKMTDGEILPERKFWHYSIGADNDDEPYGLGLGHWLYWPNYFKRNGLKSWLKFLERFAQPTAKGTYQPGTKKEELAKLKAALYAFGEDAAMMVPEGMMVELIEASRSGTADYSGFADHLDSAIAKVILSQTMTTDNGSSRSQAEVHSGVKLEVVKSDADLIDASANATWVRWLVDWNFPGAAYPTISRKLEDEENLNDRATRDKNLSDMGFRLTPEKVVEVYGDGYYDPASLEDESADQPPLVSVLGVGGTEALVGFLTALSQMSLKRENAIATLTTVFGISQSDAEAMVPEDAAPAEAAPPASIDAAAALFSEQPGSVEFGSIIDHLIKWNGLDIGVEYLPGQVRFPGRRNSKKLKSGYGHIRNHKGADGEALDCYLAPEFFNEDDISDLIYEVSQLTLDGEFDEHKLMLGYYNEFEAKGAYLREMPEDMFGGIRLLDLADLEQYRKSATAPPDVLKALGPIGQQFAEDAELSDRAFAVLQVLDQSVEVDMLTFAETQSNAAMEGAIGRRLLALIQPGVVEFASPGGKKCTKGLSCGGSCISKAKVCIKAMNPAQKQEYRSIVKAVKAGGDGADKALEDFKASLKSEVPDAEKEAIAAQADADRQAPPAPVASTPTPSALDNLSGFDDDDFGGFDEEKYRSNENIYEAYDVAAVQAKAAKQQAEIEDRIKSGDLPKPFKGAIGRIEFDEDFNVETTDGPQRVNISGNQRLFTTESQLSISFTINDSYARGDVEGRDGIKTGMAIRTRLKEQIKALPDGVVLHNSPYSSDGAGKGRERVYAKAGFGPMDSDGGMYAVVKDGKLMPLNSWEEADMYQRSSVKKSRKKRTNQ
jgi:hypothetical protein